jgi:hypothetical protein
LNLITVTAFLLLPLTACGSSGTSKDDFIADADAICAQAKVKLDPLDDQYNALVDQNTQAAYDQASDVLDQEVPVYEQALSKLEGLTPPDGDEATVQKVWEALRGEQRLTTTLSTAVVAPSADAYDAVLDEYNQAHIRTEALAEGYGFKTCGA